MRILITGASGAIGGDLIPALASPGRTLRAFGRDATRIPSEAVDEVVIGDAISGRGVLGALEGVDVAYYLIHSMEPSPDDGPFAARELTAAESFAAAAKEQGVRRIVYLGGLVPGEGVPSTHLGSRLAVERALLAAAPESVALRASIVISARSRSFRFLVRLVERAPVTPLPAWRRHRTKPIDGRDVVAYLVEAGLSPVVDGPLSLDIAGPDVMTYADLMRRIADAMLVSRPSVELPFSLTPLASVVAAAIAGERLELIEPLMHGLESDLLPRDDRAQELFGVRLHRFQSAVAHALRDWEREEELAAR